MSENENDTSCPNAGRKGEAGFSLIEVAVAMIVLLIALLGVFFTFTYAITYNAGNNSRTQALAVLQEEVERIRSLKWTPTSVDAGLTGGTKTPRMITSPNGGTFSISNFVDNAPDVAGIQDETYQCLSPQGAVIACSIKEIEIRVKLENPSPGWQSAVPATIVMRRVRAN